VFMPLLRPLIPQTQTVPCFRSGPYPPTPNPQTHDGIYPTTQISEVEERRSITNYSSHRVAWDGPTPKNMMVPYPTTHISEVQERTSVSDSSSHRLAFTRYCHRQYCMVYGIKGGGRWGGRILRNRRAIVLQQGRLCKWGGAING